LQQEKLAEMWPGGIQEFAKLFENMKGSGGGEAAKQAEGAEEGKEEKGEAAEAEVEVIPEVFIFYNNFYKRLFVVLDFHVFF